MADKKHKIVILKEDFSAAAVAKDSVSAFVKGGDIKDAVTTMATDFEPDAKTVLSNEEFGLVFADLTDAEAGELASKPGVDVIEDDEIAHALGDEDLEDGFDDDLAEEDDEAAVEIDEAHDELEQADEDELDITPADVALSAQQEPDVDEVELDETGTVISLDDPDAPAVEAAGIPRDKIIKIVKCVIKCAIEGVSGDVREVSDEKINEILASFGLPGSASTARPIRDYITCGLRIIYAPQAWRYSTGAGVRVAVIDTGITPRHPDLRVYGGASFVPGVTRWHDDHYHGTHVAGTVAALANGRGVVGVAPAARLYAVKVLNRAGSGRLSWILNGLAWCVRTRMHIVNLSLGSGATTHNPRVYSRAYENAGRALRRRGILAVAAAGNSGRTRRPFVGNPARCPSFMAVSAIDCRRRRAPFSSYGPQVEITAPGVKVLSTVPRTGYRRLSGTSMATPHVAGVASLVKRRRPAWRGDTIRVHLWRTALDLGTPGRDSFFGYGQVRAYHAVR